MNESVAQVVELFDALPDAEKHLALVELLKRSPFGEPDIRDSELDHLAEDLFLTLDDEEAASASQP